MRGVVIAGTHSGSGKTTISLGIMAAFRKKGLAVQPFKTGPDFIDAGLHRLATGCVSRNLDLWMCGTAYVESCFAKHARASDIAVIEGVMGLYDGDRSTADLAALLGVPAVLVVDAYGMAESAGAMVHGFAEFGVRRSEVGVKTKDLIFAGVVFNRVASENHYKRLKDSVRDVPVLGYLPRELDFEIPHRHLGLTIAEEGPISSRNRDKLADAVLKCIDVDLLLQKSALAPVPHHPSPLTGGEGERKIRIAVASDKAFSFYYEDNLDLLRDAGAEIVRFSPLEDTALPNADAVYIGGGYPELHAAALSRNDTMRQAVREWAETGKPLYAECGGFMYLCRTITHDGTTFPMAGVFPYETRMLKKPKLGYREVVLREDCYVGRRGDVRRGHEFHYSEIAGSASGESYQVTDSRGKELPIEGFRFKRALASYIHLHFGSDPSCAERILSHIRGEEKA